MGLYHARHRDYSPSLGRFVQRDPIGLGPDPNPYRYEANGPTSGSDPSGLQPPPRPWEGRPVTTYDGRRVWTNDTGSG